MSDATTELGEVTHTRTWDAPCELVFQCMTMPEHLTHFWGPTGVSTPIEGITVEPRVGGRFETIMVDDASGSEFPMRGVFIEFDPPHRLVWTEAGAEGGMVTSVTFSDLGGGRTETVVNQSNVPMQLLTPESQAGMLSSFDKMAAYLATL